MLKQRAVTKHAGRWIGLAIFIAILCLLGIAFSLYSYAADDVIEVRTAEDLYNVRNDLSGNYKLMNDIDLSEVTATGGMYDNEGHGWRPIGAASNYTLSGSFTGTFDGDHHVIKGMRIEYTNTDSKQKTGFFGLFAKNDGTIKNLRVQDGVIDVYCYFSKGGDLYVAPIVAVNSGDISNCSTKTTCTGEGSARYGNSAYNDSGATFYVSGIAGINKWQNNKGTITSSFNESDLKADYIASYVRSLGHMRGISYGGIINNCYNTGVFTLPTQHPEDMDVKQLGTGGGDTPTCSYYFVTKNNEITGYYYDSKGELHSLNETQMKNAAMYESFDFKNVWMINPDSDYKYPQLRSNMMSGSTETKIYTLSYDKNASDATGTMEASPAETGKSSVTIKDNLFSRSGYTFTGWNTDKDGKGTSYSSGEAITLDADTTLYAQWKETGKDVKDLQDQIKQLNDQVKKLQDELNNANTSSASTIQDLKNKIDELQKKLDKANADLKNAKGSTVVISGSDTAKLDQLQKQLDEANTALKTTQENLTKAQNQLARYNVPGKVLKLKAKAGKKRTGKIRLTWNKVDNVTGYCIYRSKTNMGKYRYYRTTKNVKYADKHLKKGKKYYYKVRAYRKIQSGVLFGEWSNVAVAKVK